jgi:hypothetical protein
VQTRAGRTFRINKTGNVVYSWQDFYGNFHGAILSAGSYYIFDAPNGNNTRNDGLNDSNIFVGRFNPNGNQNYDGFTGKP